MKKYRLHLIIIVIVALALAGSYLLVNYIRGLREPTVNVTTGPVSELQVVSFREEDLDCITVDNSSGRYVFDRDETLDSTFHWRMVEPASFEAYPFYAYKRCDTILSLEADDILEEPSGNGAVYGFDKPQATVIYDRAGGDAVTLTVGSATPTGSGCYASCGGGKVFIISNQILEDIESFNKDNLSSDYVFVNTKDKIQEVAFSREGDLVWHIRRDAAGEKLWHMVAPVSSGAVTSTIEDKLLIDLVNLQYKAIISESCDDPAVYGLDAPAYEITVTEYGGKAAVLRLASAAPAYSGFFYGCYKDGSRVFLISASDLGFLDSGAYEYVNTIAPYYELRQLSGIEYTVRGETVSADITTSETIYVFIVGNREAPDRDALMNLYTSTVWLEADEVGISPTDAEPLVSWTCRFTDGTSTKMELRDIGSEGNEYALYIDGSLSGLMYFRTKVTPIVEAFEAAKASLN